GIPGDEVGVCGFRDVIVNGFTVQIESDEVKLNPEVSCSGDIQFHQLGEDEFFLVGDSNDSLDSRTLGSVKRADIRYHSVALMRGDKFKSLIPSETFSKLNITPQ
ncbi:MAG: S26 family signal peptidase, partial [Gammaproteobacteria bacterium]|nr:S26 family signal peptidase [Gammaproteobacteria bacterium]